MDNQYITIDKIKWWIFNQTGSDRYAQPLCLIHNLRLRPIKDIYSNSYDYPVNSRTLKCEDCKSLHHIPRSIAEERNYVIDKIDSKIFKGMRFINFDNEATPIAEVKKSTKDGKYFITATLFESKVGKRLVVFAGERGRNEKTEIFIEPDIKRLAFDQKDLHPTDVFTKVEVTFSDGSKAIMEKKK
ncbi:hypothetical protein M1523_03060 [Patescibacteria group bacterium]|nr:hypothetical protein [Patescibacteria group bacterium]MCL5091299.1 hypothetical protein [Patescibacteria group bacterium]